MAAPAELLAQLSSKDVRLAEPASRALRELAKRDAASLIRSRKEILALAMQATDLRVRWNLIIVIGKLRLTATQRSVAVDWLFERLRDQSSLTRTLSLQALMDLSVAEASLRDRLLPIVHDFAENGTAAMRARARKLLKAG